MSGQRTLFKNESEFETHIYGLVEFALESISQIDFVLLENKRVADIVICRETKQPAIFFLEAKYHMHKNGRIGICSSQGAGFQPEILSKRPKYFDSKFMWVLSGDFTDKIYLLNNEKAASYVSGGSIGSKHNNFKRSLFDKEKSLSEQEFVTEIISWLSK